uniref:P-type domain-containing protein n=1 Tax=Chelonoidis abingdonii TaxID=106734 RepID=A0A8C0J8Y5_CHEAB
MENKVFWLLTISLIVGLSNALLRECDVQPKARENCGYPGITEIECSARQCCFNSDAPDSPWCFKPVPAEGKCVKDVSFFTAGRRTFICVNPSSARC